MLYGVLVILMYGIGSSTSEVLGMLNLIVGVSLMMEVDSITGGESGFLMLSSHWDIEVMGTMCSVVLIIIMWVILVESSFLVSNGFIISYEVFLLMYLGMISLVLVMSCNDFLVLYMCIELYSLCMYGMVVMGSISSFTVEAGINYFVIGVVSSGLFLLGVMMCYGFIGGTNFCDVEIFLTVDNSLQLIVGGFLISVGLFIKMGIAPFHVWVPDVYEGSLTMVTLYLVTLPKVGLFFLFMSLSAVVFFEMSVVLIPFILVVAILSLFFGTIGGLFQDKMNSLMAYSSIANSGYLLVLMLLVNNMGLVYFYVYIYIYVVLVLNVFSVMMSVLGVNSGKLVNVIVSLGTVLKSCYYLGISMMMGLLGLVGVPPLMGFFGKLCVFLVILNGYDLLLFCLIVLASLVSAIYYLSVVSMLVFNNCGWGNYVECSGLLGYVISISTHVVVLFPLYNVPFVYMSMSIVGCF